MSTELAVFVQQAGTVASTISKIVTAWRQFGTVSANDLRTLQLVADVTYARARVIELGELIRENVQQIAWTSREITSNELTGLALSLAFSQLETLNAVLVENLENLKWRSL
jgi:hypothetical protein